MDKIILKGLSLAELSDFFKSIGESSFRAKQIWEGIYKHRYNSFEEFTNLSKSLRAKLNEIASIPSLVVNKKMESSLDGTVKFTFMVEPNKEVESVWIPSDDETRKTICISSQVGCTLSCQFCATAKLDFKGNLKAWQIVDQVLSVEKIIGDKATNIVFMGMGEPMHNYHNVIRAARILNDPDGIGLGARRITISTAGDVKGIHRFVDNKEPFNLAISLNHSDPDKRKEIMDITSKFPLKDLLDAAKRFTIELKRRITFEYVMIPDVNMSAEDSKQLIKIAKSLDCKINLIPLNTDFNGWRRPTNEEVEDFRNKILGFGIPVINRKSPGKDINGACGMLALKG